MPRYWNWKPIHTEVEERCQHCQAPNIALIKNSSVTPKCVENNLEIPTRDNERCHQEDTNEHLNCCWEPKK